jgi:hypothetical protein
MTALLQEIASYLIAEFGWREDVNTVLLQAEPCSFEERTRRKQFGQICRLAQMFGLTPEDIAKQSDYTAQEISLMISRFELDGPDDKLLSVKKKYQEKADPVTSHNKIDPPPPKTTCSSVVHTGFETSGALSSSFKLTVEFIQDLVLEVWNERVLRPITPDQLLDSTEKQQSVVSPRQIAMALSREFLPGDGKNGKLAYEKIADAFNQESGRAVSVAEARLRFNIRNNPDGLFATVYREMRRRLTDIEISNWSPT